MFTRTLLPMPLDTAKAAALQPAPALPLQFIDDDASSSDSDDTSASSDTGSDGETATADLGAWAVSSDSAGEESEGSDDTDAEIHIAVVAETTPRATSAAAAAGSLAQMLKLEGCSPSSVELNKSSFSPSANDGACSPLPAVAQSAGAPSRSRSSTGVLQLAYLDLCDALLTPVLPRRSSSLEESVSTIEIEQVWDGDDEGSASPPPLSPNERSAGRRAASARMLRTLRSASISTPEAPELSRPARAFPRPLGLAAHRVASSAGQPARRLPSLSQIAGRAAIVRPAPMPLGTPRPCSRTPLPASARVVSCPDGRAVPLWVSAGRPGGEGSVAVYITPPTPRAAGWSPLPPPHVFPAPTPSLLTSPRPDLAPGRTRMQREQAAAAEEARRLWALWAEAALQATPSTQLQVQSAQAHLATSQDLRAAQRCVGESTALPRPARRATMMAAVPRANGSNGLGLSEADSATSWRRAPSTAPISAQADGRRFSAAPPATRVRFEEQKKPAVLSASPPRSKEGEAMLRQLAARHN
jgi:hypothetical protein